MSADERRSFPGALCFLLASSRCTVLGRRSSPTRWRSLLGIDTEDIPGDSGHLAYKHVLQQDVSRQIYRQNFRDTERNLRRRVEIWKDICLLHQPRSFTAGP